jgi:hypothetical protein
MAKVHMVRHQHHGVVTSHAFSEPPSEEQIAPIAAEAERIHGRPGRATGWVRVVEVELMGPDDIPVFEVPGEPSEQLENDAGAPKLVAAGIGIVTPAE